MSFSDALLVSKALDAGRDGAIDITYLGVGLAAALIMLQILVSLRWAGSQNQLAACSEPARTTLPIERLCDWWLTLTQTFISQAAAARVAASLTCVNTAAALTACSDAAALTTCKDVDN